MRRKKHFDIYNHFWVIELWKVASSGTAKSQIWGREFSSSFVLYVSTHNQIFHFWQMLIVYASTRQNRHRTSVKCDNSFEVKDCVMLIIVSKHCYRKGNAPCNYSVACLLFTYWLAFHGYHEVQPGIRMQKLTWIKLNYPCNAQYPSISRLTFN